MIKRSTIEWRDYNWNPVTGCQSNCAYCYARRLSQRFSGDVRKNLNRSKEYKPGSKIYVLESAFYSEYGTMLQTPFGFSPTLHEYRLDYPQHLKGGANIGVCMMGELFGPWVPDEWIKKVFESCRLAPLHNYFFLTKYPERYQQLDQKGLLPKSDNYWYGYSATTPEALPITVDGIHTFVCVEPILAPFDTLPKNIEWVIVGAERSFSSEKVVPKHEWIERLIELCINSGTPIYMQESLMKGTKMQSGVDLDLLRQKPLLKPLTPARREVEYSHCAKCMADHPKKDMMTIMSKQGRRGKTKTICFLCVSCYEKIMKCI